MSSRERKTFRNDTRVHSYWLTSLFHIVLLALAVSFFCRDRVVHLDRPLTCNANIKISLNVSSSPGEMAGTVSLKCTKSCKCKGYSDVPRCTMCAVKTVKSWNFSTCASLHWTTLLLVNQVEKFAICGAPLSDHYYDHPGTIGRSGVMLIASDQDNTYGRTNTMTRHIYTNNAPPTPNPCEERMENSTQTN